MGSARQLYPRGITYHSEEGREARGGMAAQAQADEEG